MLREIYSFSSSTKKGVFRALRPCILRGHRALNSCSCVSDGARWGSLAISLGGVMRKAGIGDAKACQVFQV